MPHLGDALGLTLGQRVSLTLALCALVFFFSTQACTLGYSETVNMPAGALSFGASFSPAGTSFDQVLGFYNGDPIVARYAVALQDGIEIYASASTPTSLGGRPNVNSSGSFTATVAGASPFSYLEWALLDSSQSIVSAHAPDATMGSIAYAFTTSGRQAAGGTSCTFLGPCVWAAADYWYPNSEIFTDCSLIKARLTFSYLQVKLYRTEISVSHAPASGVAPLQIAFTASVKDGVAPYAFSWDFAGLGASSQQNPSFTFESPGTYTVLCTATDSLGVSDTKSITVRVSSLWLEISSQGSGSTSPPSGTYGMKQGEQAIISATPSSGYVHDGWLLDGSWGGAANPITVVMNSNHTLKAIFVEAVGVSAWASPQSGAAPLTVAFLSLASGGTPPYSYSWSFGDGGTSGQQNCSHTYSQPGSYAAVLRVTDSAGRVGQAQLGIEAASGEQPLSIWLTKSNDISVAQGCSESSTIGVYSSSPVTATITLQWVGAVPASSSLSLSRESGATNYSSALVFSAGAGTPAGVFTLRVTASAGGVSGHIDVTITVSQAYCTLTISAEPGGTTRPSPGARLCSIGSVQQAVAIPSQGYTFDHWALDGYYYSSAPQISLFMDKDHSLRAYFSATPPASEETLVFEAMVWNGTGWDREDFSEWGAVVITGGAPSQSFSDSPHSISLASATVVAFQFVPVCSDGSLLNETGGPPVSLLFALDVINSSGTIPVAPSSASYPQSCSVYAGAEPVTVMLYLKSFDFAVGISSPTPDWGAVDVSSDSPGWPIYYAAYSAYTNGYGVYTVDTGYHISVKAEPFSGYYFDRIVVGDLTFYSPEVTLGPVVSNGSVEVYFSATPPTFDLQISSTAGGSTLPSPGLYRLPRHSIQDVAVYLTVDGYSFAGWFLDGEYAGGGSSISVMMDEDHSLLAKFEDDYWDPDRINVRPCDMETGIMYRRLIGGECIGVNVSGRISGITAPTPVSITVWFSAGSASYLGSPLGIIADGSYRAKSEAITDGSGFFSTAIGNITGCWVIHNLDPGSLHLVFAEVTAGGATYSANGSWTAEYIAAHSAFSYNLSGALATVHLTYSDGSPIEGRVGSYVISVNEIDTGFSSPNDRSGNCLLWIPYATMERVDYIASNWSISIFSNLSGSPSAIPSFLPSQIRFTTLSGQFLMHNDTHLAIQAFDWGSDGLEPVEGASAIIWWGDARIWGSSAVEIIDIRLSAPSECVLLQGYAGSVLISPDQLRWHIDASLSIDLDGDFLRGAILVTHPGISAAIAGRPSGCRLYLMLLPPDSSDVLYCPTRSGVFLLASSVAPPQGW
jgi:PKD repeat protein